jgi:hypothetical protein
MQNPRNLSWNQYNESRKFPLLYNCDPVSADGNFRIPDDFLTGFYISHNLGTKLSDPGGFFISGITWYGTGIIVSVGYRDNSGVISKVAETTIDITQAVPQVSHLLGYSDSFLSGYIIIGQVNALREQPTGEWTFNYAATTLDPFCVRFIATELSELYIRNEDKTAGPFKGVITLQAGEKILLEPSSADDNLLSCLAARPESGTLVRITALEDETGKYVKTINAVRPDADGNILFSVPADSRCLAIAENLTEHSIDFTDTCSEPCCTCTELAPINEAVKLLQASMTQLQARIDTLSVQSEFISKALLAAS